MDTHAVLNINIFGRSNNPLKSAKDFYTSVRGMGLHVAFVKPWIILSKKKLNKAAVKEILLNYEKNIADNKIKIIGSPKRRRKVYIFVEKEEIEAKKDGLWKYLEKRERKSRDKGEPKMQWAFFSKENPKHVHQWWTKKPSYEELKKANRRIKYYSK